MLSTVGCGVGTQTTSLPAWLTVGSYGFWASGAALAGAAWAGAAWTGAARTGAAGTGGVSAGDAWAQALAATSESATATRPRTTCFTSIMNSSPFSGRQVTRA